jgi:hypothetical protein
MSHCIGWMGQRGEWDCSIFRVWCDPAWSVSSSLASPLHSVQSFHSPASVWYLQQQLVGHFISMPLHCALTHNGSGTQIIYHTEILFELCDSAYVHPSSIIHHARTSMVHVPLTRCVSRTVASCDCDYASDVFQDSGFSLYLCLHIMCPRQRHR